MNVNHILHEHISQLNLGLSNGCLDVEKIEHSSLALADWIVLELAPSPLGPLANQILYVM